jgi:hypothetical protein
MTMFVKATTLGELQGRVIAIHGKVFTVQVGSNVERVHLHDITAVKVYGKVAA